MRPSIRSWLQALGVLLALATAVAGVMWVLFNAPAILLVCLVVLALGLCGYLFAVIFEAMQDVRDMSRARLPRTWRDGDGVS